MSRYSISYSTIGDIYALAGDDNEEREELLKLAVDLEQTGVGNYSGEEFIYRNTNYGMEVVSMTDLLSEEEDEE